MSAPLRCLVVDDEPLARESIRACASLDPALQIAGEAGDGLEAIRAVETLAPDLMFLDVRLPEMDGFEVLSGLERRGITPPATIFVTAYDTYAFRAFEAHAFDYLLKPVREERFRAAVAAAIARLAPDRAKRPTAAGPQAAELPRRLPVKVDGRVELVAVDQIVWIESEGNYVRLHLSGRSHLVRETMNGIEARLDPDRFLRIHRSAIVNVDCISDLRPWYTGEYIVRLRDGRELTLTRRHRDGLRRLLGKARVF